MNTTHALLTLADEIDEAYNGLHPSLRERFWPTELRTIAASVAKEAVDCKALRTECEDLRTVLGQARDKLGLYRIQHSGEYIGGVEYMELMKRIDTVLKDKP